ncbi:hypothetical protein EVAR_36385_1 [Eumeta japonica]|uniref:Secreted protein n=1 Tax=Eumeta variegata TaxID=151549 RepID=A0A4C1W5V7_EUMVA|nr:hypothetical protein EVAR_36385_1 [Eumeta japonica]
MPKLWIYLWFTAVTTAAHLDEEVFLAVSVRFDACRVNLLEHSPCTSKQTTFQSRLSPQICICMLILKGTTCGPKSRNEDFTIHIHVTATNRSSLQVKIHHLAIVYPLFEPWS